MILRYQGKSIVLSKDIKDYLDKLMEPLATHSEIKDLIKELKDDITSQFQEIIKQQSDRIDELESLVKVQSNIVNKLQIKCDDLESYSLRYCLRLNGIPVHDDEKNEDCLKTLEKCYKEINLPFVSDEIDRVHRIGKSMIEKGSGKKVRQMIVKFKS